MNELRTVADKISSIQSKVMLKLHNLNISSLGTRCEVLRIEVGKKDDWGQTIDDLKDYILSDVIIKHPWASRVQLFQNLNSATQEAESQAIDMWEFLPIEVRIPNNQDRDDKPVELLKGDMLVEVMWDDHRKPIPLILQITRIFGAFSVGFLCGKYYEASLYRGTLEDNIQHAVNMYVNSIAKTSE